MKMVIACRCCLLITFASSLGPGQAQQNVGPDLDPICLTLCWIRNITENILKKRSADYKKHAKLPSMQS